MASRWDVMLPTRSIRCLLNRNSLLVIFWFILPKASITPGYKTRSQVPRQDRAAPSPVVSKRNTPAVPDFQDVKFRHIHDGYTGELNHLVDSELTFFGIQEPGCPSQVFQVIPGPARPVGLEVACVGQDRPGSLLKPRLVLQGLKPREVLKNLIRRVPGVLTAGMSTQDELVTT